MFSCENKRTNDLVFKVSLKIIANKFFFGVSGVDKHILPIAGIKIIDFIPDECFKGMLLTSDFLFFYDGDIFIQNVGRTDLKGGGDFMDLNLIFIHDTQNAVVVWIKLKLFHFPIS